MESKYYQICVKYYLNKDISRLNQELTSRYPKNVLDNPKSEIKFNVDKIQVFGNIKGVQKLIAFYFEKDNVTSSKFQDHLNQLLKLKNLKSVEFYDGTLFFGKEVWNNIKNTINIIIKKNIEYIIKEDSKVFGIVKYLLNDDVKDKLQKSGWDRFIYENINELNSIDEKIKITTPHDDVYPPCDKVFNALFLTSLNDIKVVIIGQDPYPSPGAAMGLAFSHTSSFNKIQPSLNNILKEVVNCGFKASFKTGDLSSWAKQGVLLINAFLTVEKGNPKSHGSLWIDFTERFLKFISKECDGLVIMLWGGEAQRLGKKWFNKEKHHILEAIHPSPMNGNSFLGNKHFAKANLILKNSNRTEINWDVV